MNSPSRRREAVVKTAFRHRSAGREGTVDQKVPEPGPPADNRTGWWSGDREAKSVVAVSASSPRTSLANSRGWWEAEGAAKESEDSRAWEEVGGTEAPVVGEKPKTPPAGQSACHGPEA